MCLITRARRHPDGHQRRRPRLRPRAKWPPLAKAYLRFAERNAPRWADTALTDSHAVADIFERALRAAHRRRPLRRRGPRPRRHRDARAPRPRAAPLHPVRRAPGAREQPARARRGVRAHPAERARGMKLVVVGGAPYADEYIRTVRRAGDPRVLFPGYVFGARLLGAPAPRLRVLRADRGRRHAPGDPRGAGRGQLRARQRPRAERRDGRRRRPDVLRPRGRADARPRSSSGSSTTPSSSRPTASAPASAPGATRGTRSPTSTSAAARRVACAAPARCRAQLVDAPPAPPPPPDGPSSALPAHADGCAHDRRRPSAAGTLPVPGSAHARRRRSRGAALL